MQDRQRRHAVVQAALLGLGSATVPFDASVNIAFPSITSSFGLPIDAIQWVVIFYMLAHSALMLAFGRMGDLAGHALVFRLGLACVAVAFTLCALAPVYEWLLAARALQGVGAALTLSCGPALITSLFAEEHRMRALGAYATMMALGGALGPSLGGLLVQEFGWPGVFWFRVPIALIPLVLLRDLPAPPRAAMREPFDALGAVLLAATLVALLLALNRAGRGEALLAAILAAVALAGLAAFIRRERTFRAPMLPLGVFRSFDFSLLNLLNALVNLAGFAALLLVPYFLARQTALGPLLGGFVLAMGPTGGVIGSSLGARTAATLGRYPTALLACALTAAGLLWTAHWGASPPVWSMVTSLLLQGFGTGLLQVAYLDIVTATLPRENRGVAGSLATLTRTLGIVVGAAGLSLVFVLASDGARDFLEGFRVTFLFAASLPVLMLAAAISRRGAWLLR
ncbi:MAG: MFS transporter [Alphaproteobacteria bacterium]|nr:MFS transporter [Alphaproteobacteria bacterium]MCW5740309.1 MFS transporter [Alphaproteobacteria bacterium]